MRAQMALGLASMSGGIGVLAPCVSAQRVVYDNSATLVAWWNQVPPEATFGPEGGDEVTVDDIGRQVREFEFWYQVGGQATSGQADIRARFYANDGPGGAPGTLLWDSGGLMGVPHIAGVNHLSIPVPNIIVPDTLTWTVEFTGRTGSLAEGLGLRIYDPPLVGSSDPGYFWLRQPSGEFVQAQFQGPTPANLGARITVVGAPTVRACCLPDSSCVSVTASDCFAIGGAWTSGTCPAACPPFGACCFADGWCLELTEATCVSAAGAWRGDQTSCIAAPCTQALFNNGPLATGKTRTTGQHAPFDTYWSDVFSVGGCQTDFIGYNADQEAGFRHADNFTISSAVGWDVEAIEIYSFVAGGSASASAVAAATLRIWSGQPGEPGATVVWGDTTTDRLLDSSFSRIFKFSTSFPVFRNRLAVGTVLPPGDYWIDYGLERSPTGALYAPFVTIPNALGKSGANAIFSDDFGITWHPVVDEPQPTASCAPVPQDFPFSIIGTDLDPTLCYANCNQSTVEPYLTVDDFTCFINAFAEAQGLPHEQQVTHYANCDASTAPPALTVDDFTCFVNRFATGCP